MPRPIHVALIGQKFMGRAHSNAWHQVGHFFDGPRPVHLHPVAPRDQGELIPFAKRWGWDHCSDDWRSLASIDEVELVDALADASAGIPRMINNLATAALIVAASRGRRLVTAQDVRDAQMDRGRSMAVNP